MRDGGRVCCGRALMKRAFRCLRTVVVSLCNFASAFVRGRSAGCRCSYCQRPGHLEKVCYQKHPALALQRRTAPSDMI